MKTPRALIEASNTLELVTHPKDDEKAEDTYGYRCVCCASICPSERPNTLSHPLGIRIPQSALDTKARYREVYQAQYQHSRSLTHRSNLDAFRGFVSRDKDVKTRLADFALYVIHSNGADDHFEYINAMMSRHVDVGEQSHGRKQMSVWLDIYYKISIENAAKCFHRPEPCSKVVPFSVIIDKYSLRSLSKQMVCHHVRVDGERKSLAASLADCKYEKVDDVCNGEAVSVIIAKSCDRLTIVSSTSASWDDSTEVACLFMGLSGDHVYFHQSVPDKLPTKMVVSGLCQFTYDVMHENMCGINSVRRGSHWGAAVRAVNNIHKPMRHAKSRKILQHKTGPGYLVTKKVFEIRFIQHSEGVWRSNHVNHKGIVEILWSKASPLAELQRSVELFVSRYVYPDWEINELAYRPLARGSRSRRIRRGQALCFRRD